MCICSAERASGGGACTIGQRYPGAGDSAAEGLATRGEDHASCRACVLSLGDGCNGFADCRAADHAGSADPAFNAPAGIRASAADAAELNRAAPSLPALSCQGAEGARPELPQVDACASAKCFESPRQDASQGFETSPRYDASRRRDAAPRRNQAFLKAHDPPVPPHDLQADHGAQILPDDDGSGSRDGQEAQAARASQHEASQHHAPPQVAPPPRLTYRSAAILI